MTPAAAKTPQSLEAVDWDRYDFLDLGASRGGSIRFCEKRFGARRGLGVDNDPSKAAEARAAGIDVVVGDATDLRIRKGVAFVSMLDFLEHLPNLDAVRAVLTSAAEAATDFLFIRHPSFEGEGLVEGLGVRQYWWHWSGHPAHPQISDYCQIFSELGLSQYRIHFNEPVHASTHPSVISIRAPVNSGPYDPDSQPSKPTVKFAHPLWRSQTIYVALRTFEREDWDRLTARA